MPWWVWVILGFGLFAAESVVPLDFYLAFIGIAALTVGLGTVAFGTIPLWAQLVSFSAIAVLALVFLRRPLIHRLGSGGASDVGSERLVGEVAILMEDLAAGSTGKAELRGTVWTVRNTAERALARGERCRVRRVEGLTLWVAAENEAREGEG